MSRCLAARPELVSLDARIAAQEASVDAQRGAYWPVLSASAQVTTRALEIPPWASANNWQLGVQLTAPLLAGGADRARVRQQEAVLEGLRAARKALRLQIRLETRQLVDGVATARARREAATAIVAEARESLTIAEARYGAGVANIIELADAQRTLTSAEAQAARAEYDLAISRARVQRAIGELTLP
jgi:outer membrane protein